MESWTYWKSLLKQEKHHINGPQHYQYSFFSKYSLKWYEHQDLLKSFSNIWYKRSTRISGPQLKVKNQIMAYRWSFGKDSLKLEKLLWAIHIWIRHNKVWCKDEKFLYQTWWKLSSLIKNGIMERVRSPSPEIYDCYLKNIFRNMLANTFSDFISGMRVTDHKRYDW